MFGHNEMQMFMPRAQDELGTSSYWGLRASNTWASPLLYDKDGNFYLPFHTLTKVNPGDPWVGAGFGQKGLAGTQTVEPDPCFRPWTGDATEEVTADGNVSRTIHDTSGAVQTYSFGPKTLRWVSSDRSYLNLHGTLLAPGSAFLLPWRAPDGSTNQLFETIQYYKVDGTYCGRSVKGFVHIENSFSANGYVNTWWVQNRIGHWIAFGNVYANGDQEFGQILCGEYGARGAVVTNNRGQEVLDTIDLNAVQLANGDIEYTTGDGRQLRFVFERGGVPYGFGHVVWVGDRRKLVRSAGVEFVLGRMCTAQQLGPPKREGSSRLQARR
jgi:hypothetical protein